MSTAVRDRNLKEWLWFVLALGTVLRFQGLGWDDWLFFNPDERNIVRAAAQLSFPDHLVPSFSAYNGLALYLPRVLAGLLEPFSGISGSDPREILFAGRVLSALWSSLTLVVVANIARTAFGAGICLFVAICTAAAPALIQSAHFMTTEAGLILCLCVLIRLSQSRLRNDIATMPFAMLSGLCMGLGFGLKTTALVFAVVPAVATIKSSQQGRRLRTALVTGAVSGVIFVVLALLTTPQIWATPQAYFDTMRFEGGVVRGTQDVFWTYQFTGAVNGLFELSQLPWLVGPVVAPLGIAGLVAFAWKPRSTTVQSQQLLPASAFAVIYALLICTWHAKFVRYLTPLLPVLILFCGYLVARFDIGRARQGLCVASAAISVVAGLMQAAIYQVDDPRIAAWNWLIPRLNQGDGVAIEPADITPPYAAPAPANMHVVPVLDASSATKTGQMASALAASQWLFIASRRHYAVLPRMTARFPEMCGYYDALWSGRLGFQLVSSFRRRPQLPSWLDPTGQAEETLTVFDSPQVFVFGKTAQLSAESLAEAITQKTAFCSKAPASREPFDRGR